MILKTRTIILILAATFILFFSMATWLIHRLTQQIRQGGYGENSTYVSEPAVTGQ